MIPGTFNPLLRKPKFELIPHGQFTSVVDSGTFIDDAIADGDAEDQTHQTGATYTGGHRQFCHWDGSTAGLKALQKSWVLQGRFHRGNDASGPTYTNFHLGISTHTDAADVKTNHTNNNTKSIFSLMIGTNGAYQIYIGGTTGSQIGYIAFSSSYGTVGDAFRIVFDRALDKLTIFGSNGSFDSMTELGSYTFTGTDRSNMTSPDALFGLAGQMRGNNDGWTDLLWYET